MTLALSTSWNVFRHTSGRRLLFEIRKLGFREVELSFNISSKMLVEIEKALKETSLKVVSVHNYCPFPGSLSQKEALPDCYSMSSCDSEERRLAVKYSKRSIDTAARLGAKAVVLHCGRVQIADRTRELISLCEKGESGSKEFTALKNTILAERSSRAGAFLDNTFKSLDELNSCAQKRKILLGLETRFYLREIPRLEEFGVIFKKFQNSSLFYWHDTGHAQLMENLKIASHQEFLNLYADRMIGVHLHDISVCRDHRAISKGELDFNRLKPYINKEKILKVIEAHHPATAEEIKQSKQILEGILNERCA